MPNLLSRFTADGMDEFTKWIQAGAVANVPADLFADASYSKPLASGPVVSVEEFKDRFDFGRYLVELLKPFEHQAISYDLGLWSWLAATFFEQICPRGQNGNRNPRKDYVYVLSDARKYYRHLVRTPWYLVSTHGEACKFLLVARPGDVAPLRRQSGILDTLAARQFLIASPTLIAAASRLYSDPRTGQPRRGAGAQGSGSPRRLALIANQLSLTYDIYNMPVDRFMKLLPEEFGGTWRLAR